MSRRSAIFIGLVLLLAALPAAAADRVLYRGIDPWRTVPELTFANFQAHPLPAGFFCLEFQGYSGKIWLRGVPLVSSDPDALGATDTIVERLDNAVFNKKGVARTRVQVRALQLTGIENFKTACGAYQVKVTLDGEQPISRMKIVRESARGGRYFVPLALNVKFIFTRVDDPSEQLEFSYPVRFEVNPYHRWSYRNLVPDAKRIGNLMVDTDWDGTPDALLPGTSNFSNRNGKDTAIICADSESSQHAIVGTEGY